jgi:ubiquinone/menaquinone biosynthesis C-methylase UbiE
VKNEGWQGWDEYAPFYDWENARTVGRRDVPFWRRIASEAGGRVLELGCGTGRVSLPLARAGVELVGIDRSAQMLTRAFRRAEALRHKRLVTRHSNPQSRIPNPKSLIHPRFVRGDIRTLPFRPRSFATVVAPYGILQSLIRPRDLAATLASVARVLRRGGTFGIDLVPDVPRWREYRDQVQLRGRAGDAHLTLIESVRQDPKRHLTTFEQRYVVRKAGRTTEHRFDLTFRTLTVAQMTRQLERAGFAVSAVLGDYRGRAWDDRADVWIILARRK